MHISSIALSALVAGTTVLAAPTRPTDKTCHYGSYTAANGDVHCISSVGQDNAVEKRMVDPSNDKNCSAGPYVDADGIVHCMPIPGVQIGNKRSEASCAYGSFTDDDGDVFCISTPGQDTMSKRADNSTAPAHQVGSNVTLSDCQMDKWKQCSENGWMYVNYPWTFNLGQPCGACVHLDETATRVVDEKGNSAAIKRDVPTNETHHLIPVNTDRPTNETHHLIPVNTTRPINDTILFDPSNYDCHWFKQFACEYSGYGYMPVAIGYYPCGACVDGNGNNFKRGIESPSPASSAQMAEIKEVGTLTPTNQTGKQDPTVIYNGTAVTIHLNHTLSSGDAQVLDSGKADYTQGNFTYSIKLDTCKWWKQIICSLEGLQYEEIVISGGYPCGACVDSRGFTS